MIESVIQQAIDLIKSLPIKHAQQKQEKIRVIQALKEYQKSGGWISVDERLPEYEAQAGGVGFVFVIVNSFSIGVTQAMYINENFEIASGITFQDVTHWQPLPEAPTNQESE